LGLIWVGHQGSYFQVLYRTVLLGDETEKAVSERYKP